jgi:hypothetical protein
VASGHRCRIVDSPMTCGLGGQFLKAGPARWPATARVTVVAGRSPVESGIRWRHGRDVADETEVWPGMKLLHARTSPR